jgi:hypothetical protein
MHELGLEPAIRRSTATIFATKELVRRETASNGTLKGACLVPGLGTDLRLVFDDNLLDETLTNLLTKKNLIEI